MRPGLTLVCVLTLPLLARAAGAEKAPAALTPKEIADGWILLFDGETTYGWNEAGGSRWTVAKGMLAPQGQAPATLVTTAAFREFELKLQYRNRRDSRAKVLLWCGPDGGRIEGRESHAVDLDYEGDDWNDLLVTVAEGRIRQEIRTETLSRRSAKIQEGIKILRPLISGHLGLVGSGLVVRNVKLKPLGMKPLFNGKDLTGWKKFEGNPRQARSNFTVTRGGWLNIKNGPGDLQTEGQWADFVLQLDCISNGRHLNSGVFFRCQPGKYQQGYEAQIQNDFSVDPPKKYTVEEYDPQTHKLAGKKKVKSAAKDYGTGAIYRRVPARRPMAKDGEWFTMTVVANGRHLATWVNGIQEVDWTDNRPLNDNARNGCRLEKGPISLQGHDPTTDLSFRNLRIAELPEKK